MSTPRSAFHFAAPRAEVDRALVDADAIQDDEFETDDPAMQGEMTVTYTRSDAADGGTDLVAVHEGVPVGSRRRTTSSAGSSR